NGVVDLLMFRECYKARPTTVRQKWILIGLFAGVGIFVAGSTLGRFFASITPAALTASAIATAVIIIIFGLIMPARTVKGTRQLEKVLGFEEFLQRVESERFERMIKSPELFEKYLPYAMALKLDKNWCRAFEGICTQPPDWYYGYNMNTSSASRFGNSMNEMASSAGSAMTSAPRSSSGSSGMGGGGFSGGGFGGGG